MRSPKLRVGRSGEIGLRFGVCIDSVSSLSVAAFDTACLVRRKNLDSLFVLHVEDTDREPAYKNTLADIKSYFTTELKKMEAADKPNSKAFLELVVAHRNQAIKQHIDDFIEKEQIDVMFMGSQQLSAVAQHQDKFYLGSVSSSVAKSTSAHCCVVKNLPVKTGLRSRGPQRAVSQRIRIGAP